MRFDGQEVLRADGHPENLVHEIDDGIKRRDLDNAAFWAFLHNCPADVQGEIFDIVITYKDMNEDKRTTAKLEFDLKAKKLTMLPH